MPVSRETQNELNRRAAALSGLARNPNWNELEAEVERKIKRLQTTAQLVALSERGADQRQLDVIRGTIAGLRWFVGVPKHATATLEKYLREQGIEVEDE